MNPCIFVSVWNNVFRFFSFRVKLNIATYGHMSCLFCSVQYCQRKKKKVFVTTRVRNKTWGSEFLHRHSTGLLVSLQLFRTEAFSPSGCETDRSLKLWMLRSPPCWRQHLTLHMKTVLFHCFWVTYTFHSIMRCNRTHSGAQRWILSEF